MGIVAWLTTFITGASAWDIASDWWNGGSDEQKVFINGKNKGSLLNWKRVIVIALVVVTFWKLLPFLKKWIK